MRLLPVGWVWAHSHPSMGELIREKIFSVESIRDTIINEQTQDGFFSTLIAESEIFAHETLSNGVAESFLHAEWAFLWVFCDSIFKVVLKQDGSMVQFWV